MDIAGEQDSSLTRRPIDDVGILSSGQTDVLYADDVQIDDTSSQSE